MVELRSECGLFLARRLDDSGTHHMLIEAASGREIGECTWWSNASDAKRIRFETGIGKVRATFSYLRYPSWFRRRWIECFEVSCQDVADVAEGCGAKVLVCYKPDLNCFVHLGVRASVEVMKAFDAVMAERGVPCFRSEQGWSIEVPESARWER